MSSTLCITKKLSVTPLWEAQEQAVLAEMAQQQARRDTESLDPVPVVAYTV